MPGDEIAAFRIGGNHRHDAVPLGRPEKVRGSFQPRRRLYDGLHFLSCTPLDTIRQGTSTSCRPTDDGDHLRYGAVSTGATVVPVWAKLKCSIQVLAAAWPFIWAGVNFQSRAVARALAAKYRLGP